MPDRDVGATAVRPCDVPRASLYHDDGSHPRAAGTSLAACVLYATIVPVRRSTDGP
jgi:hypothetical protein